MSSHLYHVVAMAKNRVIGKDNKLPWHFSEDLRHFKELTLGATVIMGRKTFESIVAATKGKLLPGRDIIFLSRSQDSVDLSAYPGVRRMASMEEAIRPASWNGKEEAFIIGGEELYKESMPHIQGIYLTRIDRDYEGDAYYPEIPDEFEEVEIESLREEDPKIEVVYYERN